jgi:hypothetical protein
MTLEAGADSVRISGLQGRLWNGELNADLALTRRDPASWSSSFKGTLKHADLNQLYKQLGLRGFSTSSGTLDFDLTSADNTPAAAVGALGVKVRSLRIARFNFDKLGDTISQLTAVPVNLQQIVEGIFRDNGPSSFKDVEGQFRADHGRLGFESLNLSNAYGDMDVSGEADVKADSFRVEADLLLKQPPLSALRIQHVSDDVDYTVDSAPVRQFIIKNIPPPVQPDISPVPDAAVALPPVQTEGNEPIKGVLKRLEEAQ